MTEACIVGWSHSPFGKLDDPDIESLIGRVAGAAIADAGIEPHEIEASFVSMLTLLLIDLFAWVVGPINAAAS